MPGPLLCPLRGAERSKNVKPHRKGGEWKCGADLLALLAVIAGQDLTALPLLLDTISSAGAKIARSRGGLASVF